MLSQPQRGLLLAFAHPDDESVLAAGVACAYSAGGVKVVLVTGTRGEAGKPGDPPLCSREELPAVREGELRAAAEIMGVTEVHLLGYHDRELGAAPPDTVREHLVRVIRSHRPEVVITFDPNGSNLHPDHVAISRFISDAVAAARDPRWFPEAGAPHGVTRLLWPPRRPWEIIRAGALDSRPGVDYLIDIRPWAARKAEALRAHRTQHLSMDRIFFNKPDTDLVLSVELFRQAWGPPPPSRPADDLFAGL